MNLVAGADIAVAGGTLILAIFTWRAAAASRRAAEATDQAAGAAKVEAEATVRLAKQAREDRELAWRPHIAIEVPDHRQGPEQDAVTATITNVGNGPAIDCTFWAYRGDTHTQRWGWQGGIALRSSQSRLIENMLLGPPGTAPRFPEGIFDPPTASVHRSPKVYVVTCTDLLGNTWHFVQGHRPEWVRPDDPPPGWATFLSPS